MKILAIRAVYAGVMCDSDVYARVYLARDGVLQSIRYYGAGMPTLERIFDDRGFLSSVLMHDEDGRPMTQYYLSRTGDVIVSAALRLPPPLSRWVEVFRRASRKHLAIEYCRPSHGRRS